jgi:tripeptidyl-peptidase-1
MQLGSGIHRTRRRHHPFGFPPVFITMMLQLASFALCSALLPAAAVPYVAHESMEALRVPDGWESQGPAPRDTMLELTFAVKQRNQDKLEQALMGAADPDSPKYGEWLSNEAVHALVEPATESKEAVRGLLAKHGVTAVDATPNGDFITASVTVAQAERILRAEYHKFQHAPSGHVMHRCLSYSLPTNVAPHVDFVAPTVQLPTIRTSATGALRNHTEASRPGNNPTSLRKLYNVNATKGDASKKTKQAVTAFLNQLYSESDLTAFYKNLWPSGDASSIKQVGDAKPGRGGIESMLDIEYNTAMGGAIATEFWGFTGTAPDNKENEPFLKWLVVVSSTPDTEVPLLFSTSYGEDEDSVTFAYQARIITEFQKCGTRGISLLFASGDSGAARDSGGCLEKKGPIQFNSQWPAGSPWVTGVGATEPYRGGGTPAGGSTAESAASLSSGGFSNRWARASWQDVAVASYLANPQCPPHAQFNTSGAGFPDISAQGVDYDVYAGGGDMNGVAGTSCASPTAGGIISLVNDHRLANGKKQLGFLNPLFYKSPSAFNDIDTGAGGGCHSGLKSAKGFPAVKGWDPVTGA